MSSEWPFAEPFQFYESIVETYSSCGRTMVLYAASWTPVYLVLMFLLIKPSDLLAFELVRQVDTKVPS